ncbi:hypothetical protein IE81DRAFT_94390 [Ceraceosorus guamensis]|uniref:Transmembrane protein n=1 Tax=Ceraceosorus guamensis TaxID=1522189 RepID=A0A316W3E1_9BASI|nr:hypothetical protein IE81DRAFT_94390 [Ceraceosorus guamensis]PWN43293.1 hypothetical protein IE81DRAFT_94390 [Ceraceosorus guamensis]
MSMPAARRSCKNFAVRAPTLIRYSYEVSLLCSKFLSDRKQQQLRGARTRAYLLITGVICMVCVLVAGIRGGGCVNQRSSSKSYRRARRAHAKSMHHARFYTEDIVERRRIVIRRASPISITLRSAASHKGKTADKDFINTRDSTSSQAL